MSSTSTFVLTDEERRHSREHGDIKSPAAAFQPVRPPLDNDHFPSKSAQDESRGRTLEEMTIDASGIPGQQVFQVKETWKNPKINLFRMTAVWLAFFNLGIHDAAIGPLLPNLENYYGLGYTTVSLIFLGTFPGYVLAAVSSDRLHLHFGQRGLAALASALRIVAYITLACHPPWAVIIVLLVFCGWGNGLLDAGWNAWVGDLDRPNELLGLLHALYGLGAAVAPLIVSAMVDKLGLHWYEYYYVPIGLASLELALGVAAFWNEDGAAFRRKSTNTNTSEGGRTRAALKLRITWTIAAFLLLYCGAEVSLSGWIVTFMQRVRGAEPFDSSLTSTGFWLGVTAGRLVLGFVTPKVGERWAIVGYLAAGMALELVFWLVPQFVVSAVAVALLGFFLGPMFPAAIVILSKLLPKHLHVGAISFVAAIGMGGSALLPFAVGAIATAGGVKVLQPIILALLAALLIMWLTLPRVPRDRRND